jgi:hypothetical protein
MTDKNLRTYIAFVVDRSGSMESIRDDTIGGINTFLKDQKADPENVLYTYAQFDNVYEVVHDTIPISDAPLLDRSTFVPRSMTALLDAMGKTINRVSSYVAAQPDNEKPEKIILVIVTDGLENASREFNRGAINELVKAKQDNEGWEIVYLAANQNAIAEARGYGIKTGAAMNYTAGERGVKNAFMAVAGHSHSLKKGFAASVDFSPQERYCSTADSSAAQEQAISQYNAATGESVSIDTDTDSGQVTTSVVDSTQSEDETSPEADPS